MELVLDIKAKLDTTSLSELNVITNIEILDIISQIDGIGEVTLTVAIDPNRTNSFRVTHVGNYPVVFNDYVSLVGGQINDYE